MKRKTAIMLCLLMLSPILLAFAPAVRAPNGGSHRWVEPDYMGYDPYYDYYITGYLEGTNWNLTMMWTNYYGYPINVSAIRVYFSWGKNYTSNFGTPMSVEAGVTKVFNMYNVTPSVLEAPELLGPYWYDIYIHNLNSTTAPYQELPPIYFTEGYGFVALSQDHLDCLNYWSKYWMFIEGPMSMQPQMIPWMMPFYTNITDVQVLLTQAFFEFSQGYQIYTTGVFSLAEEHLMNGDDLVNQALDAWSERGTAMEDAAMNLQNAQANYYNGLGDSSKINAYGWVLFGLGWMFIGIGLIIYAARKPKVPQS